MPEPLQALIARIRQGDRDAISDFAGCYAEYIRSIARRRILQLRIEHETEPDEILDATVLEVCRHCDQIQAVEPGEFLIYVERVVHSQVRQVWRDSRTRKRGGGRRIWQESGSFDVIDSREVPPDETELTESLNRTYDQLTGVERLISMLRRSGWSWSEIAARCNTTSSAARKRWERAVSRVLRRLG